MYRANLSPDDLRLAYGALRGIVHKAEAAGYGGDMSGVARIAVLLENMAGRIERQGRAHAEIAMPAASRVERVA